MLHMVDDATNASFQQDILAAECTSALWWPCRPSTMLTHTGPAIRALTANVLVVDLTPARPQPVPMSPLDRVKGRLPLHLLSPVVLGPSMDRCRGHSCHQRRPLDYDPVGGVARTFTYNFSAKTDRQAVTHLDIVLRFPGYYTRVVVMDNSGTRLERTGGHGHSASSDVRVLVGRCRIRGSRRSRDKGVRRVPVALFTFGRSCFFACNPVAWGNSPVYCYSLALRMAFFNGTTVRRCWSRKAATLRGGEPCYLEHALFARRPHWWTLSVVRHAHMRFFPLLSSPFWGISGEPGFAGKLRED